MVDRPTVSVSRLSDQIPVTLSVDVDAYKALGGMIIYAVEKQQNLPLTTAPRSQAALIAK